MWPRSRWSNGTAATGQVVNAFVSGFGYRGRVAMASTVAHDSHHMIVVGTDRDQMAAGGKPSGRGGRRRHRSGATGRNWHLVELPIAGLMSDRPAREVADKAQALVPPWPTAAAR
jgi:adenine deaminase